MIIVICGGKFGLLYIHIIHFEEVIESNKVNIVRLVSSWYIGRYTLPHICSRDEWLHAPSLLESRNKNSDLLESFLNIDSDQEKYTLQKV